MSGKLFVIFLTFSLGLLDFQVANAAFQVWGAKSLINGVDTYHCDLNRDNKIYRITDQKLYLTYAPGTSDEWCLTCTACREPHGSICSMFSKPCSEVRKSDNASGNLLSILMKRNYY